MDKLKNWFRKIKLDTDKKKSSAGDQMKKLLLAAVLVLICVFSIRSCAVKDYENKELQNKLEEMERKRVAVDLIQEEVKKISKYSAYEINYTTMLHFSDQNEIKGFKIPLTGNNFIATIDGKMKIGINGENVSFKEITDSEGKVTKIELTVPHSEILDNYTIQDSLEVYDEKNNIFNPVKVSDYTKLIVEAEEKEKKKALESDIIEKSDEAAHYLLTTYFQAVYGQETEVRYQYLEEKEE